MHHLTFTGYNAGKLLCGNDRNSADSFVHAQYAPLHKDSFRAELCRECLSVWANCAYDDGDEMPEYIREAREQ